MQFVLTLLKNNIHREKNRFVCFYGCLNSAIIKKKEKIHLLTDRSCRLNCYKGIIVDILLLCSLVFSTDLNYVSFNVIWPWGSCSLPLNFDKIVTGHICKSEMNIWKLRESEVVYLGHQVFYFELIHYFIIGKRSNHKICHLLVHDRRNRNYLKYVI